MIAALAVLAAFSGLPLELELAGGIGRPIALQARMGIDLFNHVSLGASLLGNPGRESPRDFCASDCYGNESFKAIAGFVSLRLHSAGDLQAFLEGGVGIGHLISESSDNLFEDPPLRGRAGPAYQLGGGFRLFAVRNVAFGGTLAWTRWTNLAQAGHYYGISPVPDRSGLTSDVVLLMLSVGLAPWR